MNSVKTVAVVAVLLVVAYAVFVTINQPYKTPPPEAADADTNVPDVSLPPPGSGGFGPAPGGETAPPFSSGPGGMSMSTGDMGSGGPGSPGGMAPPFNPNQGSPPLRSNHDSPPFSRNQDGPPYEMGAEAPPYGTNTEPPSYHVPAEGPPYSENTEAHRFGPSEPAYPDPDAVPGRTAAFESGGPPVPGAGIYPKAPPASDIHSQFASFLEDCRRRLDRGEYKMVHLALSEWYNRDGLSEQEAAELNDLLDRLAGSIIYGRQYHLLEKPYQVKPGETLDMIAQKYNVPWELLAKINGIPDRNGIQPGQKLKVVRGPFKAQIDLSRNELTLFLQGRYAGRFRIGVGREFEINEGLYSVDEKQENPAYDGTAGFVPPDDPRNPYGEFRILLANHSPIRVQFSIHGTADPGNVGAQPTVGSICLGSPDIEDVYDILSVGSQVVIRR